MKTDYTSLSKSFYVIGLSYKKANAVIRGKFSLSENKKLELLADAKKEGLSSLLVISTCNRTELYSRIEDPYHLMELLCKYTSGSKAELQKVAYIYKDKEAIQHLFKVGTGLDSQILGDFEIIGQIKKSFNISKHLEMVDYFLERLFNNVVRASKRIKNETKISSGATSVAFASVQYIMARISDISKKNILLLGTGKIGRNTCENLVKHIKNTPITLINRTQSKAEEIAGKFHLIVKNFTDLEKELKKTDILIVATNAANATINKKMLPTDKPLHLLDLSIPKNIDENVCELPNVTLVHLDQLSEITNKTLETRSQYIPKATTIIGEIEREFLSWLETRKYTYAIEAFKTKLHTIKKAELNFQSKKINNFNTEHAEIISDRIIQKITTQFANHLKDSEEVVDESIHLIQRIFRLGS